jgi:GNAT superfamily N-acetyltransferase
VTGRPAHFTYSSRARRARSWPPRLAYDVKRDYGIDNVGAKQATRRRGLGTAVTAAQLHAARDRGCTTASLQSTRMGEGVYRSLGLRPLHRILQFTPHSGGAA